MTKDAARTRPPTQVSVASLHNPALSLLSPERVQRQPTSKATLLYALYSWLLWAFVLLLVLAQLLGIVWDSTETTTHVVYGQSPLLGPATIAGTNDEPYSDRLVVCILRGRLYKPAQLSNVLREPTTNVEDLSGTAVNGYRVVTRETIELDAAAYKHYEGTCDAIAATLDAILDSCTALGYNVTRDYLRVVDGVDNERTIGVPTALPVLIMPYWDNALHGAYSVPGWDGSACGFILTGKYDAPVFDVATLSGVPRTIREQKTVEWLARPGGAWCNGWYNDLLGMKWYSHIYSTDASTRLGIVTRHFDTLANVEHDCIAAPVDCASLATTIQYGKKLSLTERLTDVTSVAISNGSRFGLFMYEALPVQIIKSMYDLETFISNATVLLLLFRWMIVMLVLQSSYWRSKCVRWENAGIGCLACSRVFLFLPIMLLPRLKNTLMVFFSLGCNFEGSQKAFSEAWFVMYPGIVELVLFFFGLLNLLARSLRRRVTDTLFGPTLLFFCAMHLLRVELSQPSWLKLGGRMTTLFTPEEYENLRLIDFFTTGVALRVNGNVASLLTIKLVVLALNLVPLVVMSERTGARSALARSRVRCRVESVLALHAYRSSGLGRSAFYETVPVVNRLDKSVQVVSKYELARLGYVVLGDRFLIMITDWYYLLLFAPMRNSREPSHYRVVLVEAKCKLDGYEVVQPPRHFRLNDLELADIHFWQLSAVVFK